MCFHHQSVMRAVSVCLTADGLAWCLPPPPPLLLLHLQALQEIVARGADPANIRVVAVVAAPPALKLMADAYPGGCSDIQALWTAR